jgi:hypothetical protein
MELLLCLSDRQHLRQGGEIDGALPAFMKPLAYLTKITLHAAIEERVNWADA